MYNQVREKTKKKKVRDFCRKSNFKIRPIPKIDALGNEK
jgi:hypothetical protein